MKAENNSHSGLISPPFILKAGRSLLTLIFLGLAVHLILPLLASVELSLQVIKTMALWAVLLAALAQVMSYAGIGYLLYSVVAIVDQQLSIFKGALINLAATSMGMVAGGTFGNAAATYWWVRKQGVNAEGSGLAGTLPTIFNNAILMVLAVAGIIHLLLVHELSSLQFFAFLLILTLLGLGFAAVSWGKSHRESFISAAVRITASFARFLHKPYISGPTEVSVSRMFSALDTLDNGGWKRRLWDPHFPQVLIC